MKDSHNQDHQKNRRGPGGIAVIMGLAIIAVLALAGVIISGYTTDSEQSSQSYYAGFESCPEGQRHVDTSIDDFSSREERNLRSYITQAYYSTNKNKDPLEIICVSHEEFAGLLRQGRFDYQEDLMIQAVQRYEAQRSKKAQDAAQNAAADDLQSRVDALGSNDKLIIDLIVNTVLDYDFSATPRSTVLTDRASQMYEDHWSYDAEFNSKESLVATIEFIKASTAGFFGGDYPTTENIYPPNPSYQDYQNVPGTNVPPVPPTTMPPTRDNP